jgi:glycerol kinase
VWQCRRTTQYTDSLKSENHAELISQKTGLVIDPYFSSSKFRWLLKEVEAVKAAHNANNLRLGTIDSFLISKMSGGEFVTDVSNACRTQLMNIETGQWDEELLALFEVPMSLLAEIRPSSSRLATTKGMRSLPDGIPISGVAGDQQAALFGQACFQPGAVKCTFGTGSFILMNTGEQRVHSSEGLLTTVAWQLGADQPMTYALEGGAFICGAAVQWLRDGLNMIGSAADVEQLAKSVESSAGVQIVPAFAGLGAPHWDPEARGVITGLTRGTTSAHVARATLEAMALQNVEIILAMASNLDGDLKELKVDGGAVSNNLLMQLQSDYLMASLLRPKNIETTSAGAAFLAGLAEGFWSSVSDIERSWGEQASFQPQITSEQQQARLKAWSRAIEASKFMAGANSW